MPKLSQLTTDQLRSLYSAVCQELAQREDDELSLTMDSAVRPWGTDNVIEIDERIAA